MVIDFLKLAIARALVEPRCEKDTPSEMTFFEASSKSGTATNYFYKEIEKRFEESKKTNIGEVKFLSGFLLSAALLALLSKIIENNSSSREILIVYLLLVICLIIKTWMVVRKSPPEYRDVVMKGKSINYIFEKKTDEEWVKILEKRFLSELSDNKVEKIFRGIILFICLAFIVAVLRLLW